MDRSANLIGSRLSFQGQRRHSGNQPDKGLRTDFTGKRIAHRKRLSADINVLENQFAMHVFTNRFNEA
ncbi:MAG: hypothetical protein AB8B87_09715 [Granulosicoccus sp.]